MDAGDYRVRLTNEVVKELRRIGKKYRKKTYETLRDLIRDLKYEPDKKGEPLRGRLKGLYSRHYSRFRIVYTINHDELIVVVVTCGHHASGTRADIYEALSRMIDSGAINIPEELGSSDA